MKRKKRQQTALGHNEKELQRLFLRKSSFLNKTHISNWLISASYVLSDSRNVQHSAATFQKLILEWVRLTITRRKYVISASLKEIFTITLSRFIKTFTRNHTLRRMLWLKYLSKIQVVWSRAASWSMTWQYSTIRSWWAGIKATTRAAKLTAT